ncbi:hypothetical protein [Streptomyces sp. NBC_00344]|uniref:hypothetical protein n=1 Tax=Streptomyces sp. NBC_00344 TaxID=2975720 RepID=UPI002E1AD9F7
MADPSPSVTRSWHPAQPRSHDELATSEPDGGAKKPKAKPEPVRRAAEQRPEARHRYTPAPPRRAMAVPQPSLPRPRTHPAMRRPQPAPGFDMGSLCHQSDGVTDPSITDACTSNFGH